MTLKLVSLHRQIVTHLVEALESNNWKLTSIYCEGEEDPCTTADQLNKELDDMGELSACFTKDGKEHYVLLIAQNEEDVISDWGYNDVDDFNDCMEAVIRDINEATS